MDKKLLDRLSNEVGDLACHVDNLRVHNLTEHGQLQEVKNLVLTLQDINRLVNRLKVEFQGEL